MNTTLSIRHRIFLEFVSSGIPLLPRPSIFHPVDKINGAMKAFEIQVLDIVDVCVSKTKRFHANDQADIRAMVELDLVPAKVFEERFLSAIDAYQANANAPDVLPKARRNFHTVQRDYLGVPETRILFPSWLEEDD